MHVHRVGTTLHSHGSLQLPINVIFNVSACVLLDLLVIVLCACLCQCMV